MKEITVLELKRMRDQGESYQLIDVREPHEYESANIGGELIPMGSVPEKLEQLRKDIPLIIQCRSGARSGNVTQFLEKQGFQNAFNLKGGILAWIEQVDPALGKA
jgi:adenylyltransferase/sulfurtransferase